VSHLAPYVLRYARRSTITKFLIVAIALGGAAFGLTDGVMKRLSGTPYLVGGSLALLFATYHGIRAMMEWHDPGRTPLGRELARHGDLATVSIEVERAAHHADAKRYEGGVVLAPDWLVFEYGIGLAAVPYRDIAWVYPERTSYQVNSVQVAALVKLLVRTHAGAYSGPDALALTLKPSEIEEVAARIAERAPGAFSGFDAELVDAWNADPAKGRELARAKREARRG
jgi:hypothetical protein